MSARPRIVLLNPTCLDVLDQHREWIGTLGVDFVADETVRHLQLRQVDSVLGSADAVILPASIRSLPDAGHMERHKSLKAFSIAASGFDWFDVEAATRNGIVVTNAPVTEGIEVVADLAIGLMIDVARQVSYHAHVLRTGRYERGMGSSLWRKTLGIVGLGQIGKAVARRARGFDMTVLAATPHPDNGFAREHHVEFVSLEELLRRSDFVSLHVRLDSRTHGMIGARELAWMKPTAFLINTARDRLVDEAALTDVLLHHRLAGAAMDDPPQRKDSPLLALPNFVCTPHLGNRSIEGVNAVFRSAVENALAVLRGKRPPSVLNPEVYGNAQIRICLNRREQR
jgi:D-3-phosphoglycerate dehydrogenase